MVIRKSICTRPCTHQVRAPRASVAARSRRSGVQIDAPLPIPRIISLLLLLLLTSCASSELVPPEMKSQIARDISFQDIKANPERFKGRVVVVGGQVLAVKALKDRTEIEVLQLPLDRSDKPIPILTRSQGRFLAIKKEFLDPAKVPPGSNISLIGKVVGGTTRVVDQGNTYTYPTFEIKTLKMWPKARTYGPYSFPFYDPWTYPYEDPWTHPYWGTY
jgi:outer membrane lipoprotein